MSNVLKSGLFEFLDGSRVLNHDSIDHGPVLYARLPYFCSQLKSGDFTRPRCFDYLSEFNAKDCEVIEDTKNYVIRRINCTRNELKLDLTHVSNL